MELNHEYTIVDDKGNSYIAFTLAERNIIAGVLKHKVIEACIHLVATADDGRLYVIRNDEDLIDVVRSLQWQILPRVKQSYTLSDTVWAEIFNTADDKVSA